MMRNILFECLFIFLCSGTLFHTTLVSAQVQSDCTSGFDQVNEDGFGDRFNLYAWSMKTFGDHLYVGTLNNEHGGQIWRYDGSSWENVVSENVNESGNRGFRNLLIYNGMLYAGTYNTTYGAQIWRSGNGSNWEVVQYDGFGDANKTSVRAMIEYQGFLYVGLQDSNEGPGQLWRSSDGVTWQPVVLDGFGDISNNSMHTMAEFQGDLYVGTRNTITYTQLWRSSDGLNFEVVVGEGGVRPPGFGVSNNNSIYDLHVFKDRLFIGVGNNKMGFSVYYTPDGVVFKRIGKFGFGESNNIFAWRFFTYKRDLWLGVMNPSLGEQGGSLWRSGSLWRWGFQWEELVGANGVFQGYGFNDLRNWGVRTFENFQNNLYVGTAQCWEQRCEEFVSGAEVWRWTGEACPDPAE